MNIKQALSKKNILKGSLLLVVIFISSALGIFIYNLINQSSYQSISSDSFYEEKGVYKSPMPAYDRDKGFVDSIATGFTGSSDAPVSFGGGIDERNDTGRNDLGQRILIKDGSMYILVKDLDKTSKSIEALVKSNNGFVVNTSDSGTGNSRTISMTVRVPSDRFDSSISSIKGYASEVTSLDTNTDDVTEEYTDLNAKLRNLEATEAQYLEIMKSAANVTEILAVQSELSLVRTDIEVTKGRIQYLDGNSKMSLISVYMSLDSESIDVNENGWRPEGVYSEATKAFVDTLKALSYIMIWLVVFSPFVLIPGTVVILIRKRLHRKKNKSVQK